uniref:Uncharacterized protein n=1 Tax=Arundo donax TaxID=35708 RepID=A0A0A8Z670_ARUDO
MFWYDLSSSLIFSNFRSCNILGQLGCGGRLRLPNHCFNSSMFQLLRKRPAPTTPFYSFP